MDEATAKTRLTLMTAATTEPQLTTTDGGDIETLLAIHVVTEGEEWALNRAAAEGWRWKAGRGSNRINFASAGGRYDAAQSPKFCLEMARHYDERADEAGEAGAAVMELVEIEVGPSEAGVVWARG